MIKFNKYNVTDTTSKISTKVSYTLRVDGNGKNIVRICDKGYGLLKIFPKATNNSDSMTDYFEDTTMSFKSGDEYYNESLEQALRHKYNVA